MRGARIGYGMMLLVSLGLVLVSGTYHFFLLLALELTLPFFLLLYLFYVKQCLRLEISGRQNPLSRGEKADIILELENIGILPIINIHISISCRNLYLPNRELFSIAASVPPGRRRQVKLLLDSRHCGQLETAVEGAFVLDPISLFKVKADLKSIKNKQISFMVLPDLYRKDIIPDIELAGTNAPEIYSLYKGGNDPSEVFSIREYRSGDRLQQIHWKLSLRQGCLMVREHSLPIESHLVLFFDFNVKFLSEKVMCLTDEMLDEALSLSRCLQVNCVPHGISWYDMSRQDIGNIHIDSEEDIYSAIRYLYSVPLYVGEAGGKKMNTDIFTESGGPNILYFAPGIKPRTYWNAAQAQL